MDRPDREKKPTKHYDPAKEAAKPQWKKPKSKKEKENPQHIIFVSDEDEPEPPAPPAHNGPVHTYFSDRD